MKELEKLRQSAKRYITDIYEAHRDDDVSAWEHLIDIIYDSIDLIVNERLEYKLNRDKKKE